MRLSLRVFGFKSDRCGIETTINYTHGHASIRSNQTAAGLKPDTPNTQYTVIFGSNQTAAGLKPVMIDIRIVCGAGFKSDRCGIETDPDRPRLIPLKLPFKSDRCGIETKIERYQRIQRYVFKSDRCGIETWFLRVNTSVNRVFKSDRCGIETIKVMGMCAKRVCSNQTAAGLKRTCGVGIVM